MSRWILSCVLILLVPACSVNQALEGRPEPDLSAVKLGAKRDQILLQLGEPKLTYKGDQGGADFFRVKLGLPGDIGRAWAWAGLDFFTLGLWELVGSAVEANQGSSLHLAVGYDPDGRVTNILTSRY